MDIQVEQLLINLRKRGFRAQFVKTADAAKLAVMNLVHSEQSVGIGGSMTIYDMNLYDALIKRGNKVFWHWKASFEKVDEERMKAVDADVYLTSSNAITHDGILVNTDGTGNRVSAMFYGPDTVIVVCGINKMAKDLQSAVNRVKNIACPLNGRRLGFNTPCALTGKCTDCDSPQRMCNVTVLLERPTNGKTVYIILVDEPLGY